MMSDLQREYNYHYLTITGEGDADELVKQYHLSYRADAWNKGDIEAERYQFETMCIRLRDPDPDNCGLLWHEQIERFITSHQFHQLSLMPSIFSRTLHLISNGIGYQGYGLYLNQTTLKEVAQMRIGIKYYAYQQLDDGHNFLYSKIIEQAKCQKSMTHQHAYFSIYSSAHTLDQIIEIVKIPYHVESSWNIGDIQHPKRPIAENEYRRKKPSTRLVISSGCNNQQPIEQHIDAVFAKISPLYDILIPLLLDYQVDFSLTITGHIKTPYQIELKKELIENLARFKCSLDMDLYAV